MPIRVQNELPVKQRLEAENIFVMDEKRAMSQEIRPLNIVVANLMPLKEVTEYDILRSLSNTPLQLNVNFLRMKSHVSKNTDASHMDKFYVEFDDIKDKKIDGLIITGAPIEKLDFYEVHYWDELSEIMEWSKSHVTSTLHICWAAQAAMYYHYGIKKRDLKKKLSGVYLHNVFQRSDPLVRGFDDKFYAPHSRYTEVDRKQVINMKDKETGRKVFKILSDSKEAGLYLLTSDCGKFVYVMGHPEYGRYALDNEYRRDLKKGIKPDIPLHYYMGDNPERKPMLRWRSHANALYTNWINYYVYQVTPYILQ